MPAVAKNRNAPAIESPNLFGNGLVSAKDFNRQLHADCQSASYRRSYQGYQRLSRRLSLMSGVRHFRSAIAEETPMLDDLGDLRRHHLLPRGILFLDSPQHITRKNVQHALIVIIELLDSAALDQVAVEAL